MARFHLKRNDTSPAIKSQLVNDDGEPIDLSSNGLQPADSVDFHMIADDGTVTVDAPATFDDKANGIVSYSWQTGDTDTTGTYDAEFEVTYQSGAIETFPNSSDILVVIEDDLA